MSKITPTAEQLNVCDMSEIHTELKISAYAGAAKTSTLVMVADRHRVPSLMLTFSTDLAKEAAGRFPNHVECRTTHSLAYQHFGRQLSKKLKRPEGPYRNVAGTGTEIAKFFKTGDFQYMLKGERETRRMKAGGVGVSIKDTVARFEQSADEQLSLKHVSTAVCDQYLMKDPVALRSFKYLVLEYAQKLWNLRKDLYSPVLCTHDTYLKLYQLSKPDLSNEYEILYLDECQDTNACVLDIFLNQVGKCRLYAVGDGYQNIYGWRGAENAMLVLDWPEARLTKSFRFGQEIGTVADAILADNGNIQTEVKGWENRKTVIADFADDDFLSETYTILCRTNSYLIQQAVSLIQKGKVVNLEIDTGSFVKFLESAIELADGNINKVKHESLVQFENWSECCIEADVVKGELKRVVDLVTSGEVYNVLSVLRGHKNVKNPDVILTTAHKSKGREFKRVILGNDFPSPINEDGEWVGLADGERNLLYVGATRTIDILVPNKTLRQMIDKVFDKAISREIQQMERELDYILQDF